MRCINRLRPAFRLCPMVLLGVLGAADGARAQGVAPAGPDSVKACDYALSGAVGGVWRDLGGPNSRLGCPTGRESAGAPSPQGSANRVATFGQNGMIVIGVSGPRAGQAFAVSGGCYRLYVQYGGTSGWLGLPVSDQENTPDGSVQRFEGGTMRWDRAPDRCAAEPMGAAPPPVAANAPEPLAGLDLFENPATGDRVSLATAGSVGDVLAAGYQRLRGQARVLAAEAPGATRLKLYVNEARDLRETLASAQSERDALAAGYAFQAGQGWVWVDPRQGAVTLKLYRDPATGRARLTAGAQDEREAAARGYGFVRIEGYALPAP